MSDTVIEQTNETNEHKVPSENTPTPSAVALSVTNNLSSLNTRPTHFLHNKPLKTAAYGFMVLSGFFSMFSVAMMVIWPPFTLLCLMAAVACVAAAVTCILLDTLINVCATKNVVGLSIIIGCIAGAAALIGLALATGCFMALPAAAVALSGVAFIGAGLAILPHGLIPALLMIAMGICCVGMAFSLFNPLAPLIGIGLILAAIAPGVATGITVYYGLKKCYGQTENESEVIHSTQNEHSSLLDNSIFSPKDGNTPTKTLNAAQEDDEGDFNIFVKTANV